MSNNIILSTQFYLMPTKENLEKFIGSVKASVNEFKISNNDAIFIVIK